MVEYRLHSCISSVDELPGDEIWLIIRIDDGNESVKYQFSNAPPEYRHRAVCPRLSCSRYWIERAFEDGKGNRVLPAGNAKRKCNLVSVGSKGFSGSFLCRFR